MEIMRGKQASFMDAWALTERLVGYDNIHIDLGTGDGHYVRHIAQSNPTRFVIGIDSCRENMADVSRRAPLNTLFVIANARALPPELHWLAAHITINFPWGSLLEGLLAFDSAVLSGLMLVTSPRASLDIRLNGGALAAMDYTLEQGTDRVRAVLAAGGFVMQSPAVLKTRELKTFPTSWAKRLAYGRDPRAVYLRGVRQVERQMNG